MKGLNFQFSREFEQAVTLFYTWMTAVDLLPMHGVGLVPTVSDVVEQAAHARILSTFLSSAEVVIHNFVYNVVRNSTSSVWNPDKEETNMLWEAVSVCSDIEALSLHSILTLTGQSVTHLMTKSMSLLAMVTITSGTLYGVLKWLSMVALTPPKTKVQIHADRRLCYGNKMKLYKQTDFKNSSKN